METLLVLYIVGREAGSSTVHREIIVVRMATVAALPRITGTLLLHCISCSSQSKELTYCLANVSEHRTLGVFPNLVP